MTKMRRAEENGEGQMEIRYRERRYLIPTEEVIILPINNSSAENLAGYLGHRLLDRLRADFPDARLTKLILGVEETPGQQGIVTLEP